MVRNLGNSPLGPSWSGFLISLGVVFWYASGQADRQTDRQVKSITCGRASGGVISIPFLCVN